MNEEIKFILDSAKEAMVNALKHLEKQFVNIRAGKASPSMLGSVMVDYYGSQTPLSQVANVNTPDGRTITVQPWEKTMLQEIQKRLTLLSKKSLPVFVQPVLQIGQQLLPHLELILTIILKQ